MSYRLIDANALAIIHKEVNDMPCIYADLPNGLDGGFYDMTENNNTRWHELFGTPERAARTLSPDDMSCRWCLLHDHCKDECLIEDYDALLEWLRGDA